MKNILVRKIFQYDPTCGGKYSRYDGYRLIGLREIDPPIDKDGETALTSRVDSMFCSSLRRGIQSAELYSKKNGIEDVTLLSELDEVVFDLKNLLSRKEYDKLGSNLVRERFLQAFIADGLVEKRIVIKQRIDGLLGIIKKCKGKEVLLISHSFFMKLLQCYLRDNRLFDESDRLRKYFVADKKTFEFGEGFDFSL